MAPFQFSKSSFDKTKPKTVSRRDNLAKRLTILMINCGSERSPGLFIRKKSSATNLGSVKTKRE